MKTAHGRPARAAVAVATGCLLLAAGCGPLAWLNPWRDRDVRLGDSSYGIEVVDAAGVVEFHQRASRFYGRLAHRRFNVIGTFRDEVLREFFRTDQAFSDYYADFAQDLTDHDFERNRPGLLDVQEFAFEGPGEALVRLRIVGDDGRPLRRGQVVCLREDRWERIGGTWWIVPGKL